MLIRSPRQSRADIARWAVLEHYDGVLSRSARMERREARALETLRAFAAEGPCYLGVSWGKDSVVVAHLAAWLAREGVSVPAVWVRVEPIANPECAAVRDAFLARWPLEYHEIVVQCRRDAEGWHATGTLEAGFAEAIQRWGSRHVSGVRADESSLRGLTMARNGESSDGSCRPIGWWSGEDVFAYLRRHDLPVHPAYAMSFGGGLERNRIRVASLGGERGTGKDRRQWEEHYYADVLRRIRA